MCCQVEFSDGVLYMIWNDMIWYMIWYVLLQLGFHSVAVVGILEQNRKETALYEMQYTKQYRNTVYTKYETEIQTYILTYLLHGAEYFLRS